MFISTLFVGVTTIGEDFALEFVLAGARVGPLASVSADLTPARVASLPGFATLFSSCDEVPNDSVSSMRPRRTKLRKSAIGDYPEILAKMNGAQVTIAKA